MDYARNQRRTVNNSCWIFLCFLCSSHLWPSNCPSLNDYVFPPQSVQWGHSPIHKPRSPSPRWVLDSVNLTAPTITPLTLCSGLDSMDISNGVEEMEETLLKYLQSGSVRKLFFIIPRKKIPEQNIGPR